MVVFIKFWVIVALDMGAGTMAVEAVSLLGEPDILETGMNYERRTPTDHRVLRNTPRKIHPMG
jgi:hypothetical protein